jgi:hypothetical protein
MTLVTRVGVWLFALALAVYVFTAGGSLTTTDAVASYEVTRAMVDEGSVAMRGNLLGQEAERGRDGRYYSPFGIGQSLYNVPFYLGAKLLTQATGLRVGKSDTLPKAIVALGQTVVAAAIVRETFLLAAGVAGDLASALLAAVTLAFASALWPYSGFGFNQPLTCLTLVAAARQAFAGTRTDSLRCLLGAGFWLAASLLTRHEMALAFVPFAVWVWFDGGPPLAARVRRLSALAPGLLIGIAVWMTYNVVRFGHPLNAGQDSGPGFGSPIVDGLLGLLASPSASLFLYSPFAAAGVVGLMALARRDRSAAAFFGALIGLFVIFYATLGNWLAGRSYGSRYLVIVLPFLAVGWAALLARLAPRPRLAAFVLAVICGAALQVPGVLMDYAKVSQAVGAARRPFTTEERQWRWDASPLVLNSRALARALPDNIAYLSGRRSPPAVAVTASDQDRTFSQQFSFSLDLWWIYLYYLHVLPRWAIAIIAAMEALALWIVGRGLRRALRLSGSLY